MNSLLGVTAGHSFKRSASATDKLPEAKVQTSAITPHLSSRKPLQRERVVPAWKPREIFESAAIGTNPNPAQARKAPKYASVPKNVESLKLINEFLVSGQRSGGHKKRGWSNSTLHNYNYDLNGFVAFLEEDGQTDLLALKLSDIKKYTDYLLGPDRKNSYKTVLRVESSLTNFFQFLEKKRRMATFLVQPTAE